MTGDPIPNDPTPHDQRDDGDAAGGGDVVRAAGGIIWRVGASGATEVLLVHRDRYDDWTFPKGKLDPGESWRDGAVREVHEETGMAPDVGDRVADTNYVDHRGRVKVVRYWAMTVDPGARFIPNDEVDAIEWSTLAAARAALSYDRDRSLLDTFAAHEPG